MKIIIAIETFSSQSDHILFKWIKIRVDVLKEYKITKNSKERSKKKNKLGISF